MSELADIERALMTALNVIRENWDALLAPSSGGMGGTASSDVVTGLDRRISLRHEVTLSLNGWVRLIVEERELTHGLPLRGDVPGMIDLMLRHAVWLSGHEVAGECSRELTSMAARVKDSAEGNRVAKIQVGRCPEVIWATDDEMGKCTGNLWASIRFEESMLPKFVVCDGPEQHSWAPHEWAALGRRVTPPVTEGTVA